MNHKKILVLASLLSCTMLGMVSAAQPVAPTSTLITVIASEAETVSLKLSGLWGPSCASKVRSALTKLDGVSKAKTTVTSAKVTVDREKVSDKQLIKAVKGAGSGFSAKVVKK